MDFLPTTIALSALIVTLIFIIVSSTSKRRRTNRPPSPPSLPFIGHLHLLKQPLHRTLQTLSSKYGPIFSLKLGVRNAVIISSPSLVEECLNKNDLIFANRPHSMGWEILGYNCTAVAAAPYGPHWRNLRRLSAVELLSTARLNSSVNVRQDEVRSLVSGLVNEVGGSGFGKVEMWSRLAGLSMNMVMRMVAGKRYFDTTEGEAVAEEGERFKELISEVFELIGGVSSPTDFLPLLKWVDFGGVEKRMWGVHVKMDAFFQRLIDEHRNERRGGGGDISAGRMTMIDTMLSLQESEPETYSDDVIKGHAMSMILGGTDTTAITIQWALSLLLNHPHILEKARAELDDIIGNNRLVQESDYSDLPYLQCIINETFRLYPVAPLLIPHQPSEDCTVGCHSVSKGTMLFVNIWAIQTDPTIWEDPTRFWPERHVGVDQVDAYKLLPFGVGRRACPGAGLANRVVSATLGALIQCFEWERISEGLVDMTEGHGLTMPKLEPLQAMCKPREFMREMFSSL